MRTRAYVAIFLLLILIPSCAPAQPPLPEATATASLLPIVSQTPSLTVVPSPTSTATPLPPIDVSFYKVRLEYTTTSDWTRLKIQDATNILTYSIREITGDPFEAAVFVDGPGQYRIELNRPPSSVPSQPSASMTIDLAFASDSPPGLMRFIQEKGAWNSSTLKILLVQETEFVSLQDFWRSAEYSEFTADLSVVAQYAPSRRSIIQPSSPKMLWAFYYPWYKGDYDGWSGSGWLDPIYIDRPLDHYSSANRDSVENQIRLAQGAGLDGFIVSYSGEGEPDTQCFEHLLDYSAKTGFRIAFMVEGVDYSALSAGGDASAAAFDRTEEWIRIILNTYGDHPGYMQINDKPLILLFGSFYTPSEIWQEIFSQLESEGLTATYWGHGYRATEDFDGIFEYGVPDSGDLSGVYTSIDQAVIYQPLLHEDPSPTLWAASVMPGFDNTPLIRWFGSWPSGLIPRQDGAFYRTTFNHALLSGADWIIITSWNEYQENSHIEPSEMYGDEYLMITAEYAQRWKVP